MPMSGIKNPYNPIEFSNQWLEQVKQIQTDVQKGFERTNQQFNDINSTAQAWKQFTDQIGAMSKFGSDGAQQFTDMMRSVMNPWRMPAEYMSVPNMLTEWAAFKTSIGSNGRISIPEAERSALGLGEGDLVQVVVLPVSKKKEVKS